MLNILGIFVGNEIIMTNFKVMKKYEKKNQIKQVHKLMSPMKLRTPDEKNYELDGW